MTTERSIVTQVYSQENEPIYGLDSFEDSLENNEDTLTSSETLSPTADRIDSAVSRVTGFLRNRAEQKQKVESQEDAFASYEDNIQTTKDREKDERRDAAKAAIKNVASSALTRLKNAGMIGFGLSIMAGEAASRGAKTTKETVKTNAEFAYAAAKNEASNAAAFAGEKITNGWTKAEAAAGKAGAALENGISTAISGTKTGIENAKYAAYATKESIKYTKERFLARREAARGRKYERHAHWMSLKGEAKAMAESYRTKRAKNIGRAALGNKLFER